MDDPSGAQMVARTEKVKDRVAHLLKTYPQTKGDDLQLIWKYYQKYTDVRISFQNFKSLLMCPSPETIRRRRQELQQPERQAVANGEISLADCQYLPRERTERKRHNYKEALKHYYGKGLTLNDFE